MIEVRRLSKHYEDTDGSTIRAVEDVVLHCRAGEVYGLLGANGAGKTTTLRCLATILQPTSGTAVIAGYDLIREPEKVRQRIGFLSAGSGSYARLTPRETLYFFGSLHGMSGEMLKRRVEETLALFDITKEGGGGGGFADRAFDKLSTGMKQRVGLARAVIHDPPVLILDEPTAGLDPVVSKTVEDAVVALAKTAGKCVLFSTHLLEQAQAICDRIGIIGGGKVLAEGTLAELCAATGGTNLREVFFALQGKEGTSEAEVVKGWVSDV